MPTTISASPTSILGVTCLLGLAAGGSPALASTGHDGLNDTMNLRSSTLARVAFADGPIGFTTASVSYGETTLILDLETRSVRSGDFRVLHDTAEGLIEMEPGEVATFVGTVRGLPEARVAGGFFDGGIVARIATPGDNLWIEPVGDRMDGAMPDAHVVYHQEDIIHPEGTCAADFAGFVANKGQVMTDGEEILVAELAVDADFFYQSTWGASTEARIELIVSLFNNQYESEVFITHEIVAIIVRTTMVYTTSDASALLNQLRSRWLSSHGSIHRDVVHLFTGRNLVGSTIGVAWLSAVCTSLGFGLVQSDCCGSAGCATDLSAHELGHNWGAGHCSCSGWTMNPSLTCANRFIGSTESQILAYKASIAGCLEPLCQFTSGDVTGDGVVDLADLLQVLADWGCEGYGECPSDTNCDGIVATGDLLKVLANWDD